jgi:hypothetical protein
MRKLQELFVPGLTVAAYSALLISLVGFGLAVAALSVALIALVGGGPHAF